MRANNHFLLRITFAAILALLALGPGTASGERNGATSWRLLTVAYPDARDVDVSLGGSERALTARGLLRVKWRDNQASVELEADQMPAAAELGVAGGQYVLWAVSQEKQIVSLGPLPLSGKKIKSRAQVPFRIFGLMVTAESDPQAKSPSGAVALESRLPLNPNLVLPVFRIEVPLTIP